MDILFLILSVFLVFVLVFFSDFKTVTKADALIAVLAVICAIAYVIAR